jgi:hypothetical protein
MTEQCPPKPQTYNGDLSRLPAALAHLREQNVWVCWRWFWNGRKWTKPPRRVDNPDRNAASNDPATWGSYEQAVKQVREGKADGIGVAIMGRDLGGIDLDHCRDPETGTSARWAEKLLERFPNAYREATVSGKGLRILGTSTLQSFAPKFRMPEKGNGAAIELFSNSNHYLTVSCNEIGNCTELPPIGDDMARLAEALGRREQKASDTADNAAKEKPRPSAEEEPIEKPDGSTWSFAEELRLRSALNAIPTDEKVLAEKFGSSHDTWIKIGMAIERLGWNECGYAIWRGWSTQSAKEFNEKGLRAQWASFQRNRDTRENTITIKTVFYYARHFGWEDTQKSAPGSSETIDPSATFTFLGNAAAAAPRELIKKLLPAYGVAVTGGQPSAGKTFIAMHKAICLATREPFFGRRIVERVGTAFVAAEGRALIPNRFAAALAKPSITDKLPIAWIKQLPDFSTADGVRLFVRQLKPLDERFQGDFGMRLGQVTIDTVAACFSMKDEDDNAEATKVCNVMRTIGEDIGALMAPIHHYGKNPESGLRGASAWRGSADIVEGVLADIDALSGRVSNRELVCAKARDGEQGPISPFELEFVQLGLDDDGEIYGSCCVVPADGKSRFDQTAAKSKGARAIQDAINEVLDGQGKLIVPRASMPPVKAAKVIDVRAEFERRYAVAEADPEKAAHTKYMAFKRALDRLSPSQFAAGATEGADWIWKI